jgi:tetratricopeptide (TPR) repeat protein
MTWRKVSVVDIVPTIYPTIEFLFTEGPKVRVSGAFQGRFGFNGQKFREEVEARNGFHLIDAHGVIVEGIKTNLVGDDEANSLLLRIIEIQEYFEVGGRDGHPVTAPDGPLGLFGHDRSGDDVEPLKPIGPIARQFLQLPPDTLIKLSGLGTDVGKEKGFLGQLPVPGKIREGSQVTAVVARAPIVVIGRRTFPDVRVTTEVTWALRPFLLQVFALQDVGYPFGLFPLFIVAEQEASVIDNLPGSARGRDVGFSGVFNSVSFCRSVSVKLLKDPYQARQNGAKYPHLYDGCPGRSGSPLGVVSAQFGHGVEGKQGFLFLRHVVHFLTNGKFLGHKSYFHRARLAFPHPPLPEMPASLLLKNPFMRHPSLALALASALAFLLLPLLTHAQNTFSSTDPAYVDNVTAGEAALKEGEFDDCLAYYAKAFAVKQTSYLSTLRAAACAFSAEKEELLAKYLDHAFSLSPDGSMNVFKNYEEFAPYYNTELAGEMKARFQEAFPNFDQELADELAEIRRTDQENRRIIMEISKEHGWNSPKMDSMWAIQTPIDEANTARVAEIIDERGYPGKSMVGDQSGTAFLVIQHADLEVQERYLDVITAAADEGEVAWRSVALLVDRVRMRQGKTQLYGSQVSRDPETNESFFAEIENPHQIDSIRATVGLGPIQEYAERFGFKWDPEKHLARHKAMRKEE